MDRLSKLLDEFRHGIINERQYAQEMDKLAYLEDKAHIVATQREISKLASQSNIYSVTPEEVVLEREECEDILRLFSWLRELLGDKDWDILCKYVIDRWTFEGIAKKYKYSNESVIRKKFMRIIKKIGKNGRFCPIPTEHMREILNPSQSKLEATAPETKGYPFEFLQNVSEGGRWEVSRRGIHRYKSLTKCHLPEYFSQSFGDHKTVCTICTNETGINSCRRNKKDAGTKQ